MTTTFDIPKLEDTGIMEMLSLMENIRKPIFNLKDFGISSKMFHDWRANNILSPLQTKKEGESYRELKLSFSEWIWMQILYDLRKLGISYKNLQAFREMAWYQYTTEDYQKMIWHTQSDQHSQEINKKTKKLKREIRDFNKNVINNELSNFIKEENFECFNLEGLICTCLITKDDIKLLLRFDGEASAYRNIPTIITPEGERISFLEEYNELYAPFPHVSISITTYINIFFSNAGSTPFMSKIGFVDENEMEVLEMLRKKGLKELTVKMDPKLSGIAGYVFTSAKEITNEELFSLTRSLILKEYESVSFVRKDNKRVYFERTTKKHIKK